MLTINFTPETSYVCPDKWWLTKRTAPAGVLLFTLKPRDCFALLAPHKSETINTQQEVHVQANLKIEIYTQQMAKTTEVSTVYTHSKLQQNTLHVQNNGESGKHFRLIQGPTIK